jgi:hypothetical protein
MVPRSLPVCIFSDSKAALQGIESATRARLAGNARRIVRQPMRAAVLEIDRELMLREEGGTLCTFIKVKAHTTENNRDSCGNRAADALAKYFLTNLTNFLPIPLTTLDIPATITVNGTYMSGDPRKAIGKATSAALEIEYRDSPSQGPLVRISPALLELARRASSIRGLDLGFALRLLTDTLPLNQTLATHGYNPRSRRYDWLTEDTECPLCHCPVEDIHHLINCPRTLKLRDKRSELWRRWFIDKPTSTYERIGGIPSDSPYLADLGISTNEQRHALMDECLLHVQALWYRRSRLLTHSLDYEDIRRLDRRGHGGSRPSIFFG